MTELVRRVRDAWRHARGHCLQCGHYAPHAPWSEFCSDTCVEARIRDLDPE